MGFHINPKIAAKKGAAGAGKNTQSSSSKFIQKPAASNKAAGPAKRQQKTGGTRGS